jgi:hypothetical protein
MVGEGGGEGKKFLNFKEEKEFYSGGWDHSFIAHAEDFELNSKFKSDPKSTVRTPVPTFFPRALLFS